MEKIWLYKLDNIIHGPLDIHELRQIFLNNHLPKQTQVTRNLKQWVYAKNCEDLEDLFQSSQSKTQTHSHKSKEELEVLKAPHSSNDPHDKTVEGELLSSSSGQEGLTSSVDIQSAQEVDFTIKQTSSSGRKTFKDFQFGSAKQSYQKAQIKVRTIINAVWVVVIFFILFPAIYFLTPKFFKNLPSLHTTKAVNLIQARTAFEAGDYPKALYFFRESKKTQFFDKASFLALILHLEKNTYLVRRQLDHLNPTGDEEIGKKYLLQALVENENQQWAKAEDFFNQAQAHIQDPSAALLGKAFVQYKLQNISVALGFLDEILKSSSTSLSSSFVSFLKILWSYPISDGDVQREDSTSRTLQRLIQNQGEYSQEALLFSLHQNFVRKNQKINMKDIQNFLDRDPHLTMDHKFNVFSYHPHLMWSQNLYPICSDVYKKSNGESFLMAMHAFCQMQAGFLESALKNIEKALHQSPAHPLIQSIYSMILYKNNLQDKSTIAIELALQHNQNPPFILPFILKARMCEREKDFNCSRNYWKQVQKYQKNSLSAMVGLATAFYEIENNFVLDSDVKEKLKKSPHYIPFLKLSHKLNH